MKPLIIGISGKKGVGKDATAARLVDKWGFQRVSFADQLKEAARIIFHFTDAQLYGDKKEVVDPRWGKTPREILQLMGTDALRKIIDDEVWVKSTEFRIAAIFKQNLAARIVIPDLRFPNEANAILAWGNKFGIDVHVELWRVERDIPQNEFSKHISEIALDEYKLFTQRINNNKTLANLYQEADRILTDIVNPKKVIENALNRRSGKDL